MTILGICILTIGILGAFIVRLVPFLIGIVVGTTGSVLVSAVLGHTGPEALWSGATTLMCSQVGYAVGIGAQAGLHFWSSRSTSTEVRRPALRLARFLGRLDLDQG